MTHFCASEKKRYFSVFKYHSKLLNKKYPKTHVLGVEYVGVGLSGMNLIYPNVATANTM